MSERVWPPLITGAVVGFNVALAVASLDPTATVSGRPLAIAFLHIGLALVGIGVALALLRSKP